MGSLCRSICDCGLPLRVSLDCTHIRDMKPQSEPNQDMSHPSPQAVSRNTVTKPSQMEDTSMVSPREGFGRGVGLYVDKFMDQRRRKELEYRVSESHILMGLT